MRRKRLLVAGLALAGAMVAGVAVWLGSQSPLERYTTPPLGRTKYRVSLMIPRGWVIEEAMSDVSAGSIILRPPTPPTWVPRWIRWGYFKQPAPEDMLKLVIYPNADSGGGGFVSEGESALDLVGPFESIYQRRLETGNHFYDVVYSRSTKQDFETTRMAIYNSIRLVE